MKQVRTLKNEVLMRSSHKLKFKRRKCIYTIKQRLINLNLKYLVIQIKLEYLKSILHSRSSLLPSYCTSHQNTLTFCLETAFQSRTQQLATSVLDTFLIFLSVCLLGGGQIGVGRPCPPVRNNIAAPLQCYGVSYLVHASICSFLSPVIFCSFFLLCYGSLPFFHSCFYSVLLPLFSCFFQSSQSRATRLYNPLCPLVRHTLLFVFLRSLASLHLPK